MKNKAGFKYFYSFVILSLYGLSCFAAIEPGYFSEQVQNNELPPITERLPEQPLLMDESMGNITPGKYGGKLRMLMAKDKDIRRMVVYGYSRLVGYNENLELIPDIVESFENNDNMEFIFHLQKRTSLV